MDSISPEITHSELNFLKSIHALDDSQIERLSIYHRLLLQWQEKTNLVAPSTLEHYWQRHIGDSLQLLALKPATSTWTDIGSGAGFPGMVLAVMLAGKENANVHLVESNGKKVAFLRKVALETGAAAKVHPLRIESSTKQLTDCKIITARALASVDILLGLTSKFIYGERIALFHKGRDFEREITECHGKWKFDLIVHESRIDAESVLLEISNVERL